VIADELVARALRLADAAGHRVLLGIAGGPGAGKTTLAVGLVERLCAARPEEPAFAAHVPMDGFHLADAELDRLGIRDRKGAVDTFDGWGYLTLLQRLTRPTRPGEVVYAPAFERDLEQPLAGAIAVRAATRVIVTEGNYLLVDAEPWRSVRTALDEVWFCRLPRATRLDRLTARHRRFGKSPAAARAWAAGPDERNAELIEPTAARADLQVADGFVVDTESGR